MFIISKYIPGTLPYYERNIYKKIPEINAILLIIKFLTVHTHCKEKIIKKGQHVFFFFNSNVWGLIIFHLILLSYFHQLIFPEFIFNFLDKS